jgi:ABC-2 type transport system ATP-binding protein
MTNHAPSELAIEAVGVTKRFGDKPAVDHLQLSIPKGTAFGFIGPNGAGKSTTIKMLMGLLPMDSGSASVLGIDVGSSPQAVRRYVGYVPEQHFIYRWMRVRDVIRFCRSLYDTWNDNLCDQLLDQFQLTLNKKVKALSKGMIVKLALILAVAHEPRVLILDEPTAGLDPIVREEFLDGILRSVTDGERTVLFSSHTLSDVQRLADSVGIIHEGKLLIHCPVDDLLSRTKRIRMVLDHDDPPPGLLERGICGRLQRRECVLTVGDFSSQTVGQLTDFEGVEVLEVTDVSLEDAFKDYIKGRRVTT